MLSAKKGLSYQDTNEPPLWTSSCCLLRKLRHKMNLVEWSSYPWVPPPSLSASLHSRILICISAGVGTSSQPSAMPCLHHGAHTHWFWIMAHSTVNRKVGWGLLTFPMLFPRSKGLEEYWLSWGSCLFGVPVDEIISSAKLGLCLRDSYALSAQQPGDAVTAITTRKCTNSRGGNGGSYLHDSHPIANPHDAWAQMASISTQRTQLPLGNQKNFILKSWSNKAIKEERDRKREGTYEWQEHWSQLLEEIG